MKVRCPACRQWAKWEDNPFRPFCGEACQSRDLGNWANEKYRIPEEDDSEKESEKPQKEE